ncbi:hypothetical protein RJ639_032967 [Escallonia herrerae]|uniref:NFXL1 RRM-like domain-containing protein n=1 Tax=Escallonia herrerae TaxID=1293975 RepID=A0AA88X133_9ASTE|nr:hypothetical protein RJ639_032967 [Escallonia herrerae]
MCKDILKRLLGGAFGITPPNLEAFHFGENFVISKVLTDLFRHVLKWMLSVEESTAGWEPKRFVVVHVTPKSRAPACVLGAKGPIQSNLLQPPVSDALVDMDSRLVVTLFNLPSDADISALVLRFGGEYELVRLNDKNALAIFSDPVRAATAMRRLDQGFVHHGATVAYQNGSGSEGSSGPNAWVATGLGKDRGALAAL